MFRWVSALEGSAAQSEAAGELRYLSIKLLGYVAELPSQSLPPRGRVPWSAADLSELRRLARAASAGEADAALAADALEAIDGAFQRGVVEPGSAAAGAPAEAARLADYQARRVIAMDRLPQLHRRGSERAVAAPGSRVSIWERIRMALSRVTRRA
jgi:hypothetical protein